MDENNNFKTYQLIVGDLNNCISCDKKIQDEFIFYRLYFREWRSMTINIKWVKFSGDTTIFSLIDSLISLASIWATFHFKERLLLIISTPLSHLVIFLLKHSTYFILLLLFFCFSTILLGSKSDIECTIPTEIQTVSRLCAGQAPFAICLYLIHVNTTLTLL